MSTAVTHPVATAQSTTSLPKVRGYWGTVGYRLRHDYVTLFFGLLLLLIVAAAVTAPWPCLRLMMFTCARPPFIQPTKETAKL